MRSGTLLTAAVALLTLGLILWPLDLSLLHVDDVGSRIQLVPGDVGWILDAVRNVAAFVPLGLALRRARWATVAALCALLSTSAEVLQILQPYRFVSVPDVAFNTLGGLAGRGLAASVPRTMVGFAAARLGLRLGVTSVVVLGTVSAVHLLQSGLQPSGWRTDYLLAMNSSALGQVPWCGSVERLEMTAGSATWAGEELGWDDRVMERGPCRGAAWWAAEPPPALARAVQSHRGLAIDLAATPSRDQLGPARILTWADTRDGRKRNVLIAQESDSLVVYARRRLGGEEGRRPYYVIPGVFEAGITAAVTFDINEERTIIRTDTDTLVHRHDLAQDWPYLVRGRSPYAPGGDGRAVAFWSAAGAPASVFAGAGAAALPLLPALAWIGSAVLALMAGGLVVTGAAPSPAVAGCVVAIALGLAARACVRGASLRFHEPGSTPRGDTT